MRLQIIPLLPWLTWWRSARGPQLWSRLPATLLQLWWPRGQIRQHHLDLRQPAGRPGGHNCRASSLVVRECTATYDAHSQVASAAQLVPGALLPVPPIPPLPPPTAGGWWPWGFNRPLAVCPSHKGGTGSCSRRVLSYQGCYAILQI